MRSQYPGVVIGRVKEIDEPNAAVKLEFPWLEENYRSDWAPIAVPMSGKNRGVYFLPEPDDDVLVAFNQGNFDSPYVVGFLWNGVDTPPESDRTKRVIKTPGGHTLRFEDTDGSKKIILKSSGGQNVTIDDASGVVTVSAASKVVVDAPQIELTSGATHPLAFGDLLLTYLNTLVTQLQSHTHPFEVAAGVLPVTPMPPPPNWFTPYPPTNNSLKVKTG